MSAFPFDTHLPSTYPCHSPSLPPFVSPCDCHHTLLCFISVPFPLFLLKLSSNLHIQLSSQRDSTVSRRAAVSACCLRVLGQSGIAGLGSWSGYVNWLRVRLLCQSRCYCFQAVACLGSFRSSFSFCALFFLLFEVFTTLPAHNGKQKA